MSPSHSARSARALSLPVTSHRRWLEHRVTGDQRGGVTIGAEAELHNVEHGWRTATLAQQRRVIRGAVGKRLALDRHAVERRGRERVRSDQQVRDLPGVAPLVARRDDPLVDLKHLDTVPVHAQARELMEHAPRRLPAGQRECAAAAARARAADLGAQRLCGALGGRFRGRQDLDAHDAPFGAAAVTSRAPAASPRTSAPRRHAAPQHFDRSPPDCNACRIDDARGHAVTEPDDAALDAESVATLARLVGYPPFDAATAARIATGAASAVAAVRAAAIVSLFDCEPGSYLAELERLAEPGS